ncbi:YceI family protein [Methyloversatilis universalis]|uniref:YceI family protein n=1 Tax=Methyloversatilis universalis TaxID=378211 RepID=UPI0003693C2E|nr:YceI family protein [Methyloversatilis universalis]
MKKTLIALFGTFAGLSMTAGAMAADSFTIDSRHTFPVFEVNHLGFSTQRGRFNNVTGKIMLVPSQKSGSIEVNIDSASIDMGMDAWDKQMRGEDFFNVEKFPNMSFKSTKLVYDGDKLVGAEGDFTLLGVTKPVKLEVKGFTCGTHPINKKALCGADISTVIKRSEFGMTKYVPSISDDVVIKIPVEAFKD